MCWVTHSNKYLQATIDLGYNTRMTSVPDWLSPPKQSNKVPDWLSGAPRTTSQFVPRGLSAEGKAVLFQQFENITPRILELVCEGFTLNNALKEIPLTVDPGAYIRWLRRQPQLYEMYKEAKEVRTEAWAGEILRHAEGKDEDGNESLADTARSRLIVDTYKWLMQADNRKQYGDTKTVEVTGGISIIAAMEQAQGRVIEAQLVEDDEVDVIDATEYKRLSSGSDEDNDE